MIFPRTSEGSTMGGAGQRCCFVEPLGSLWAQQNIYNAQEQPKLIELLRSPDAPLYEKALWRARSLR